MSLVSYAQNFEDVLLHRVFGGQEIGFYVDVGAYHPVDGSVTKLFYDRGWSGINVEPGIVFDELVAVRPRDVNLRMAVLDHVGEVTFVDEASDGGMSHVAEEGRPVAASATTRSIPCDTLENIVRAHARGRPVDFLKVDAEGAEAAIVRSTDWRRLRPRVLVFEATLPWSNTLANEAWEPALIEQGYARVYFDGINCFYVPEEEFPLLQRHFRVPVNVLDQATRHDPAAAQAIAERDRCGVELAAKGAALDALRAEHTALTVRYQAAEDAAASLRSEHARQSGEHAALRQQHGSLRSALERLQDEAARTHEQAAALLAERDALASCRDALIAKRDEAARRAAILVSERDALHRRHEAAVMEQNALRRTMYEMEAQLAPSAEPSRKPEDAPQQASLLLNPPRRSLGRRAVRHLYAMFRPMVRPAAWRLRGFMTSDLAQQVRCLEDSVRQVGETQRGLGRRLHDVREHVVQIGQHTDAFLSLPSAIEASRNHVIHTLIAAIGAVHGALANMLEAQNACQAGILAAQQAREANTLAAQQAREAAGAAELRRLAAEMEHALLTLALEAAAPDTGAQKGGHGPVPDPAVSPPSLPTPATMRTQLQLAGGRTVEVECSPGDLSVAAALAASGGAWEPHIRRYLERVAQPDWVCVDIGANLGAHTLSLAAVAHAGRVVAFEADPNNHALLVRNVAAMAEPKAWVEPLHLALWDTPGTLVMGGADELAGCSFVVERTDDAATIEDRLRAVIDPSAITHTLLHPRRSEVPALPLDDWAAANGLSRLDFIKLDVEGAEVRVLRGANETLRRHRPMLLVEYNPACAAAYFGQPADALFRELNERFAAIHAVEEDGSLTPMLDWDALRAMLEHGKGWEDLVCLSGLE